jgi:hypothetical protein
MGATLQRWKVEAKVIAGTAATGTASVAVAVLNDVEADHRLLGGTPAVLQTLILMVVPPIAAFLAGWKAKHTPRVTTSSTPGA